jgi:hypothetical protein
MATLVARVAMVIAFRQREKRERRQRERRERERERACLHFPLVMPISLARLSHVNCYDATGGHVQERG